MLRGILENPTFDFTISLFLVDLFFLNLKMVGGGSRRDEGSLVINNTNVFAALETLRKKKKSDKERKNKGSSKSQSSQPKEPEPQVFWAPAPLTSKSWADVDDEDDDDYYATTAPPQAVWGSSEPQESKERPSNVEVWTITFISRIMLINF